MSVQEASSTLTKKGMVSGAKKGKVRTVEVGDGDIVFIEVPAYRLPTLQQLSGTTFSIRLYPLDK